MTTRHAYSTASTLTRAERQIAEISIRGVVTDSVSALLLADCQRDIARHDPGALIADYSGAALAIDRHRLMRRILEVVGEARDGALMLPTALVVPHDQIELWRGYSALLANHGILRGVFTDAGLASAWAREKAAVYQAMRVSSRTPQVGS